MLTPQDLICQGDALEHAHRYGALLVRKDLERLPPRKVTAHKSGAWASGTAFTARHRAPYA
jgi:hypothetical protein